VPSTADQRPEHDTAGTMSSKVDCDVTSGSRSVTGSLAVSQALKSETHAVVIVRTDTVDCDDRVADGRSTAATPAAAASDSKPNDSAGVQRSTDSSLGVRDCVTFMSDSTLSNIDVRLEALNKLVLEIIQVVIRICACVLTFGFSVELTSEYCGRGKINTIGEIRKTQYLSVSPKNNKILCMMLLT